CDGSATEWRALIAAQSTLVFYMGKEQAFEIERSLLAAGVSHDLPIAFVTNGSRANQQVSYGCLGSLSETAASIRLAGPSLLIIGEVIKQGQLLANLLGQLTRSHHLPASVQYNAEVAYG
ncbi:MAG TPA: hypothetical protein VLA24_15240, partial [Pseudomonadales bacterium]|nr:hypothetical protein [Pseudomonadales bacterium]